MRVFVSIFTGLVLGAASMARAGAETSREDTKATRPSAVVVSAHVGFHRDAIGAGVIVALGPYAIRVVTARHVTSAGDVTIWIAGVGYPADVVPSRIAISQWWMPSCRKRRARR